MEKHGRKTRRGRHADAACIFPSSMASTPSTGTTTSIARRSSPHNIGLGATRDPAVVERAARVTAEEVAGTGINWTFAPCVAVARDERWGRTYESFGEDPELVATMGAAAVQGLQGADLAASSSVLSCTKHFWATAARPRQGPGRHADGPRCAAQNSSSPYEAAIKAGTKSIMVSYSSWNGRKMHARRELITGLLKDELKFQGFRRLRLGGDRSNFAGLQGMRRAVDQCGHRHGDDSACSAGFRPMPPRQTPIVTLSRTSRRS